MKKNKKQTRDYPALANQLFNRANELIYLYQLRAGHIALQEIVEREKLTRSEEMTLWITLKNLMAGKKE